MTPSANMLSVAEARTRLLAVFYPLPAEAIPLAQAVGRVLTQEVIAAHSVPTFANSSMDGYAVRVGEVQGASRTQPIELNVSGDVPAGALAVSPLQPGTAMRIMTGAPLPAGAEAVIPVEDTDDRREHVGQAPPAVIRFFRDTFPGANVRPIGQDIRAGEVILTAGTLLQPAAIGVLAALGQAQVSVYRTPLVALFSTGDELCEVTETPAPGQIRDVNNYTLAAAIEQCGARVLRLGIARDKVEEAQAKLSAAQAAGAQLIVSSAGVSVGAYDVVKAAVESQGALDFWRVRMRPGKPVAFGQARGIPFAGLPGNPVSALVTFEIFLRPAILKMSGWRQWERPAVRATLAEPLSSDGRESYVRVVLHRQGAEYVAHSTGDQGSAVLTSLVKANALLILPEGVTEAKAGEQFEAWVLD